MKKVFLVMVAFAALSFTACKSGKKTEMSADTTAANVQEATQAVSQDTSMHTMPADTTHMADTTKKM